MNPTKEQEKEALDSINDSPSGWIGENYNLLSHLIDSYYSREELLREMVEACKAMYRDLALLGAPLEAEHLKQAKREGMMEANNNHDYNDPDFKQDPFSFYERECPECHDIINECVITDTLRDCADHFNHEGLILQYRWLKAEHEKLQKSFLSTIRGMALEEVEAELEDANRRRAKLGAERYLLEKEVRELRAIIERKDRLIDSYERALEDAVKIAKELGEGK